MPTLPAELLPLIVVFAPLFSKRVWEHAKILLARRLVGPGKRTVTACLRAVGLVNETHFQNYHRVLNRAKWDALAASRIVLHLILGLLPAGEAVVIAADDTIERRRGRKIKALGYWRDPLRSSRQRTVNCYGLKWLALAVCLRLPWSRRVWALPFLTALCPGKKPGQRPKVWPTRRRRSGGGNQGRARGKARAKQGEAVSKATPRQYKTAIDRLMILARLLHRWVPERLLVLSVDGAYAAVKLALVCARTPNLELAEAMGHLARRASTRRSAPGRSSGSSSARSATPRRCSCSKARSPTVADPRRRRRRRAVRHLRSPVLSFGIGPIGSIDDRSGDLRRRRAAAWAGKPSWSARATIVGVIRATACASARAIAVRFRNASTVIPLDTSAKPEVGSEAGHPITKFAALNGVCWPTRISPALTNPSTT